MSTTTLRRLSGLALISSGVLALVGNLANPGIDIALVNHPLWTPMHALVLLAFTFALLGLPGLYATMASRLGIAGLIGYTLYMLRLATSIGSKIYDLVVKPVLATDDGARALASDGPIFSLYGVWGIPLSIVLAGGTLLFGVTIVRSKYRARRAGVLIVLGSIVSVAIPPVGIAIRESGLAWLGLALWREQRTGQRNSSPTPTTTQRFEGNM